MTQIGDVFKSYKTGKIGTVVDITDSGCVLDVGGSHRTVMGSNLKKNWKFIPHTGEELDKIKEQADKLPQVNTQKVEVVVVDNGDDPPKPKLTEEYNKFKTYLERKGCTFKYLSSYERVRFGRGNVFEIRFSRLHTVLTITCRFEALKHDDELLSLGTTVPETHYYTLDHKIQINKGQDMQKIYRIVDACLDHERKLRNEEKKKFPKAKNGKNRIDGKPTLAYKRRERGTDHLVEKAVRLPRKSKTENVDNPGDL